MTSESKSGILGWREFLMPPENADLGQIRNQGNVRMWRPEDHDDVEIVLTGFHDDDKAMRAAALVSKDFAKGILNALAEDENGEWSARAECKFSDGESMGRKAWIEAGIDAGMNYVKSRRDPESCVYEPNPRYWIAVGEPTGKGRDGTGDFIKVRMDHITIWQAVARALDQWGPMESIPDVELRARRGVFTDDAEGDMKRFSEVLSGVRTDHRPGADHLSACPWLVREQAERMVDSLAARDGWTRETAAERACEMIRDWDLRDPDCMILT